MINFNSDRNVDVLFVVVAGHSREAAVNTAEALQWSSPELSTAVVIADAGNVFNESDGWYTVRSSDAKFSAAQAIVSAINDGFVFEYVMIVDDRCLIISSGFVSFLVDKVRGQPLSVLGKRCSPVSPDAWTRSQTLLFQSGVPTSVWEEPPPALSDGLLLLSSDFVRSLLDRQLLVPAVAQDWPASYGAFLSWTAHMLGYHVLSWGTPHRMLPPLYLDDDSPTLPAPSALNEGFGVLWPATRVPGYSFTALQELCRQHRGCAPQFDVPRVRPEVTGPDIRNIAE